MYTHAMWQLIMGISGISILGWFVNSVSPSSLSVIGALFFIIGMTVFSLSYLILKSTRRAGIVTGGMLAWLLLRFVGLRDWYYPFLLILIIFSLDILLRNDKMNA